MQINDKAPLQTHNVISLHPSCLLPPRPSCLLPPSHLLGSPSLTQGQDPSDDSNNVNKNSSGGSGTSVISRSANVFSKHVGTNGLCTEKENTAPSDISAGRAMSAGQSASSFVSQYGPRAALNKPMPPAGVYHG